MPLKLFWGLHLEDAHERFLCTHRWAAVLLLVPVCGNACGNVLQHREDMPIIQFFCRHLLRAHQVPGTSLIKEYIGERQRKEFIARGTSKPVNKYVDKIISGSDESCEGTTP